MSRDLRKLVIRIEYVHPPIPYRGNDWSAHVDGDEESGRYGWGISSGDALRNLIEVLDDAELLP